MRNYELLTIVKPNMDADEADKIIAKIEENIVALGGKVNAVDKMGRKKLAHDILNFRDGHFTVQKLQLDPAKVTEFKRQLKLNDNVLRIMFVEDSKARVSQG